MDEHAANEGKILAMKSKMVDESLDVDFRFKSICKQEKIKSAIIEMLPDILDKVCDDPRPSFNRKWVGELRKRYAKQSIHKTVIDVGNSTEGHNSTLPKHGYGIWVSSGGCEVKDFAHSRRKPKKYDTVPLEFRAYVGMLKLLDNGGFVKDVGYRVSKNYFFVCKEKQNDE